MKHGGVDRVEHDTVVAELLKECVVKLEPVELLEDCCYVVIYEA